MTFFFRSKYHHVSTLDLKSSLLYKMHTLLLKIHFCIENINGIFSSETTVALYCLDYYFCAYTSPIQYTISRQDEYFNKNEWQTEGFHWLHEFDGEGLILRQLLQHSRHLKMPHSNDVLSVNAFNMISHTDHLYPIHHTALFDTLPNGKTDMLHI